MGYYSLLDIPLFLFYMLLIFLIAWNHQNKRATTNPTYRYFMSGMAAHIVGAASFCLIYTFYYSGGDTLNYHDSSQAMINLFFTDPGSFWGAWLFENTPERHAAFNEVTGYPQYWDDDTNAFNVVRLIIPLELISFRSYLITSMLLSVITYLGSWRLYQMFYGLYPSLYKGFGIVILFAPSVLFWGSGILKDTFTFAAMCWFTYAFYELFMRYKRSLWYVTYFVLSIMVLLLIKPYIFIGLFPAMLIWKLSSTIKKLPNLFTKVLVTPIIMGGGIIIGTSVWIAVSGGLGKYSTVEGIINKAHVSQSDLKQDHYEGNSFDIGDYDPTLSGMLSKSPSAMMAGLFRPFLWESKNVVMMISGLENFVLIVFFVVVLLKSPYRFISTIVNQPTVLFCFTFVIIFSFAIGISTSNFGALVRFKIPLIPFFLCGLLIINNSKKLLK